MCAEVTIGKMTSYTCNCARAIYTVFLLFLDSKTIMIIGKIIKLPDIIEATLVNNDVWDFVFSIANQIRLSGISMLLALGLLGVFY